MKLSKDSPILQHVSGPVPGSMEIIPYIEKMMAVSPAAGIYEVDDSPYVSKVTEPSERHFHPSGDCLACPRLLYWQRRPETAAMLVDDITPRLQVIFKMGDAVHAMIQAWFAAMDKMEGFPSLVGNEVRLDDPVWNIGGFIDSVVRLPGRDHETVVEIKSINDYGFSSLRGPKAAHKLQVGCYLMERECPHGIVLYFNKNTGEMKEFPVYPFDMTPTLRMWSDVRLAVQAEDPSGLMHGCKKGDKAWERCPARAFCK